MTNEKIQFAEWVKYAEEDLKMAELALKEKGPPNQICFHAQQVAEKYLKGFLVYSKQKFEKVHQLQYLLQLCAKTDVSFEELREDVLYLTRFYIETRYPGDFQEFTLDEAQKAYNAALQVKNFVLKLTKE